MSSIIIGISTLLQFVAGIFALYLIKITGKWKAWSLLAIAMTLMGVRRLNSLYHSISENATQSTDLTAEIIALTISVLMVVGVLLIAPIFKKIQETNIKLQKSETKFRNLIEGSLQGIFVHDGYKPLFANQKAADIFGYNNPEEILALDSLMESCCHPEEHERLLNYKTRRLNGDTDIPNIYECRGVRKDGSSFWFENNVSTIDWHGQKKYLTSVTDITERKLAKDKIIESEELFRNTFEQAAVGIAHVSPEGFFLRVNQRICNMLGYNKEEMLTKTFQDITYSEDLEKGLDKINKLLTSEIETFSMEKRYICKDQSLVWANLTVALYRDERGTPKYFIAIIEDISKRKIIELRLKESEERYALAMQGANDGLWDWDVKINDVYFSPRWKSMLGYAENEIENRFSEWERLLHPEDLDIAKSRVQAFLNDETDKYESEFRMQHKDGHYVNILARAFAIEGDEGNIARLVGTHVDITDYKQVLAKLNYQSSHDALTGLVNRSGFEHRAERLLSSVKQDKTEHALCYMDLDQFKIVNDTCGHIAGDEMLRQLSAILQKTVRHRDTLARLGGDEFGVLMEHCSLDDAHRVATSLLEAIQDYQFAWEEHSFRVGVSIGLVPITESTTNLTELLIDADAACYMAKDTGRNRIHVYHTEDSKIAERHGEMQWVPRIQHALEENRFCLYAQSIVPLNNSTDKHYELLIRMIDDKGDMIPPGAFLPAAERYNLITKLDYWVIETVFNLLKENPEFQSQISFISINLSGQSLAESDLLNFIITQLDETGINGEKICFEITETAAISNMNTAMTFISTLKGLGCRFALDDFGSGLSSFAYLKNLPVDYLKIDGMFVKDIVDDPIDHAMVKSINEIGQVMGMQTIAEFVENDEIKGMLREIGVNYAQGYGVHKPQPLEELLE